MSNKHVIGEYFPERQIHSSGFLYPALGNSSNVNVHTHKIFIKPKRNSLEPQPKQKFHKKNTFIAYLYTNQSMGKSKKSTGNTTRKGKQPVKNLHKEVIAIFRKNHSRFLNYKQVSSAVGLNKEVERQQMNLLLQSMKQQGILE
jgi:hypothetical protein